MGRDNHPRMRQKEKLERQKAKRASYDRVLIVCEGKKTEPQYFREIRQFYKLHTTNIQIMHSDYGTTPQQVVNFARDLMQKTLEWEQVYCVFDRDDHPNFENALKSTHALNEKFINELGEPILFIATPSIPCFELWLLLHFVCVTKEIHRDKVLHELRHSKHLPHYEKGQSGHFLDTRDKLPTAFKNSAQLLTERTRHAHENPYTAIGGLVKYLIQLSES